MKLTILIAALLAASIASPAVVAAGHITRRHVAPVTPVIAEQFEASVLNGGCPAWDRPKAPGEGHADKARAERNNKVLEPCWSAWLKMSPIDRMGALIMPDDLNVFDPTTSSPEQMTSIAEQFRAYALLCPAMNNNVKSLWPPGRVYGASWKAKAFEVLETCWTDFIPRV